MRHDLTRMRPHSRYRLGSIKKQEELDRMSIESIVIVVVIVLIVLFVLGYFRRGRAGM
jgi:hypothetical protein